MAILSSQQRADLWAQFMREFPKDETLGALTKVDLRAAVDALDQFLSDNAAAVNNSIPQPARSELTARQKALLLIAVVRARFALEG